MNMRFSIATQLDIERLDKAIVNYYEHTVESYDPYIFMNTETLIQLSKQTEDFVSKDIFKTEYKVNKESYVTKIGQSVIAEYKGHKVYIDFDLKYGEILIK